MLTKDQIDARALPSHGQTKMFDGTGTGLYLLITAKGGKGWRLKYKNLTGKATTKSFGSYPEVPPEVARERCEAFRKALSRGVDPVAEERKERDAAMLAASATFGRVGAEFLQHDDTKAPKTAETHARQFHHLSKFHGRPLDSIQTREIVQLLEVLELKGNRETAHRVASFVGRVYRYAVQKGYTTHNPARDLKGALKPVLTVSHAGITDLKKFGELMRLIDGDDYSKLPVRNALRMLARVAVRPGELRQAEWREFDLQAGVWRIPALKMKMRRDHIISLSRQVREILAVQQQLSEGSQYVFPGARTLNRPISDGTLGAALKSLFYSSSEMVPHGFRTSFSTIMNENGGYDMALIELQLAHARKDAVAAIYDRSQKLPERAALLQDWADLIDRVKVS